MDDLQTIREVLEYYCEHAISMDKDRIENALAALSCLEARAAEMPDAIELVKKIRQGKWHKLSFEIPPYFEIDLSDKKAAIEIGQYAYRYSEDIRKDRDYWKDTATAFHDAIHQHIENHRNGASAKDNSI